MNVPRSGGGYLEVPRPEVNLEICTGCGDCVNFCPTGAVAIVNGKVAVVNEAACTYCTECEALCPSSAIRCPYEIILVEPEKPAKKKK